MHLDWCKTGEKSLKIQLLSGRNWFFNMLECSCDSEMNYRHLENRIDVTIREG